MPMSPVTRANMNEKNLGFSELISHHAVVNVQLTGQTVLVSNVFSNRVAAIPFPEGGDLRKPSW